MTKGAFCFLLPQQNSYSVVMKALSIKNLTKVYQNHLTALADVSLDVFEGDFFALLGPNGAGKTTLIGVVSSLVNKTSGKVWVFDQDIDKNFSAAKSYIGVVPQEFNFSIFETVENIVLTQAGYYGLPRSLAKERAEKYLKRLDLWHKRKEQSRMLSGGMKRRLMIARALMHEPKLLILDEPTAGVDVEIRYSMWEFLREINKQGTTIILTTHYLEEAENLCRDIAIIDHGKIIRNTSMRELLADSQIETFVLDLKEPVLGRPDLGNFPSRLIESNQLEVDICAPNTLNELFALLSARQIHVTSLKNKANRLETLFMRLVGANNIGKSNYDDK